MQCKWDGQTDICRHTSRQTCFCILLLYPSLVRTSYLSKGTITFVHEHQAGESWPVSICADSKHGTTPVKGKPNIHTGVQTVYTTKVAVTIAVLSPFLSYEQELSSRRAGTCRVHNRYSAHLVQIRLEALCYLERIHYKSVKIILQVYVHYK